MIFATPYPQSSIQSSGSNFNMEETTEKIDIINVRLNSELINVIDSYIQKGVYSSRAEFIREMCRNYVLEERFKNE